MHGTLHPKINKYNTNIKISAQGGFHINLTKTTIQDEQRSEAKRIVNNEKEILHLEESHF